MKKCILYTLTTEPDNEGNPATVEKHEFKPKNKEIQSYLLDGEDFESACRLYLYEEIVMECNMHQEQCIILTEEQFNYIRV